MPSILIIEDNVDLAAVVRDNLELEGYGVTVAHDGEVGLRMVQTNEPDLLILDLGLPHIDGIQILSALRRRGHAMPVIVLSARNQEVDKLLGFRLGADDYVTKPFGVMELLARVAAVLRRGPLHADAAPPNVMELEASRGVYRFGDVVVNAGSRTISRGAASIPVSPKAFDLLVALLDADGAVLSRKALLREIWGYADEVASRTLDAHIAELRRRIERDPAAPEHILTARKTGYRLRR